MGSVQLPLFFMEKEINCSFCGNEIEEFRDSASLREFKISGMCQKCQDKTFDNSSVDNFN